MLRLGRGSGSVSAWQIGWIMQAKMRATDGDEGVVEQLLGHQPRPAAVAVADRDICRDPVESHRLVGGVEAQIKVRMGIAQHAYPGTSQRTAIAGVVLSVIA